MKLHVQQRYGNVPLEIMGTTFLGHLPFHKLFVQFDLLMLHKQWVINSKGPSQEIHSEYILKSEQ